MKSDRDIRIVVDIPEFPGNKRPTSDKQNEANRRNAQKATGPTSEEGKEVSSMNAIKTGVFSTRAQPITRGPFKEDENEFYDRLEELVEAQNPRDALERAVAEQIALVLIRMERHDEVSVAAIQGESRFTHLDGKSGLVDEWLASARVRAAWAIVDYLEGKDVSGRDDVEWRDMAWVVRNYGPVPGTGVKGLWTKDREPRDEDEWRKAFVALMEHFWNDNTEAASWAHDTALLLFGIKAEDEQEFQERVASRILHQHSLVESQVHNRLVRDLRRLSDEYRILHERDLDT